MSSELIQCLDSLKAPRIGVVGDLMLDEYVWGDVERISPEAPIPVLRVSRRSFRVGGAGSVAVNLARLGAHVSIYSQLGADAPGAQVRDIFETEGCDQSGVQFDEERRTTVKFRHMGFVQQAHRGVQQLLRVDEEELRPVSTDVIRKLLARLRYDLADLDAVLISDYDKGLVSEALVQGIVESAGDVPVLVDPALLEDYARYRGVTLICPNRFESELASAVSCREITDCPEAARKLLSTLGLQAVAMTLDREGILLCEASGATTHFPTRARTVADVTGAGDMVLTLLGLVLAAGGRLDQAVELANVAAGIEVRHLGVRPVSRDELRQALTYQGHPAAGKHKRLDELARVLHEARQTGKTVVFTNGCFDLLHLGHHHLLNGAREKGDLLVVAVNSDASIRRLKGPERPRIPEEDRVTMIAGLEAVDFVTVFEEDTPNHLLEVLRPDVLIKGSEYREGIVVGREIVEGYGGRVDFVDQIPGVSTTKLIRELEAGKDRSK